MAIKILFCGETVVDMIGNPEGGPRSYKAILGGSHFNGAVGAARTCRDIGVDYTVHFVGPVSKSEMGDQFIASMTENGVETSSVTRVDRPDTLTFVIPRQDGKNGYSFYLPHTASMETKPDELPPTLGHPDDATIACFGCISAVRQPSARAFFRLAETGGERSLILFDLNVRPSVSTNLKELRHQLASWAQISDVIKASQEDIDYVYKATPLEVVAQDFFDQGVAIVIVTKGAEGAEIFTQDHRIADPGTPLSNIKNTVGAGDHFTAGIAVELARQRAFERETLSSLTAEQLSRILKAGHKAAASHLAAINDASASLPERARNANPGVAMPLPRDPA